MILSRAAWYTLLAVIEVGTRNKSDPDTPVLARDIASASKAPGQYLAKMLTQLVKARILSSGRGPTGGYFLAVNASELSLLEIVEVAEGQLDSQFPLRRRGATPAGQKKLGDALRKSTDAMRSALASQKLAKLL